MVHDAIDPGMCSRTFEKHRSVLWLLERSMTVD